MNWAKDDAIMLEHHPPEGTVTLLFTDIEGSTKRWEARPQAMATALKRHDHILRTAIETHGGFVFKTIGDAFCAAFADPAAALQAALDAQCALAAEDWGEVGHVRVRMALHTGTPEHRDLDYFGPPVNRVARMLATGAGSQVLVSDETAGKISGRLPAEATLIDLGAHRLKDLLQPQRIFQLVAPGLDSKFPPLKSLDRQPHNLPAQATPLVGREAEVAQVRAIVEEPAIRLATLTGPGGTGKTRLGLQVAADLVEHFPDGAWFVDLAPLPGPEFVVQAIAQPLGVRESGHEPLETTLIDYLRDKRLLLVLDNCEHVLGAAPAIGRLLASCRGVKALATSRAALRIYGEREVPIPPLALPDAKRLPPLDELAKIESVELFVERAAAVKPGFDITEANAAAIASICVRLEGLPLAIELAAARVRILPPDRLLDRLADRLALLTSGASDRDPRQQTLRGAIAWSYDLLSEPERELFRPLSVFAGGFSFEAAETLCAGQVGLDVLDGLESLVAKSLLRQEENADEVRFRMLETIREFAAEQLEASGEAPEVRARHAAYILELAGEAEPHLTGPEQGMWMDRLETEHDNLRAALHWLSESRDEEALRLAGALWRFWLVRGHLTEGRGHLEHAIADVLLTDDGTTPGNALTVLDAAGVFAEILGDLDRAAELHERGLALAQRIGDARSTARSMSNLGTVFEIRGDLERASKLYEQAMVLLERIGDQRAVAIVLENLFAIARLQNDLDRAEELAERSLGLHRGLGDERSVAIGLQNLGMLAYYRRDFVQAADHYQSALTSARSLRDRSLEAYSLVNLGMVQERQGNTDRSAELLEEALPLFQELGDKAGIAFARYQLGMAAHAVGNEAQAKAMLLESLELRAQLGEKYGVAQCLEGLGAILTVAGAPAEGVMLFAAADALRTAIGAPLHGPELDDHKREIERARRALDEGTFDGAWAIGQVMSPEQAIAELV